MSSEVTLTRAQVERLATFFALQENVERVTITETHESGIGLSTRGWFHTSKIERDFEADLTDVTVW